MSRHRDRARLVTPAVRILLRPIPVVAALAIVAVAYALAVVFLPAAPAPTPTVTATPPPTPPVTFATACAHAGYCDLDTDSICTIIYLAEEAGTPFGQIMDGLEHEAWRLARESFDACPQYLPYWNTLVDRSPTAWLG